MTFIIFVIVINLMAIKLTAIKYKACDMKFYDRKKEIAILSAASISVLEKKSETLHKELNDYKITFKGLSLEDM